MKCRYWFTGMSTDLSSYNLECKAGLAWVTLAAYPPRPLGPLTEDFSGTLILKFKSEVSQALKHGAKLLMNYRAEFELILLK